MCEEELTEQEAPARLGKSYPSPADDFTPNPQPVPASFRLPAFAGEAADRRRNGTAERTEGGAGRARPPNGGESTGSLETNE